MKIINWDQLKNLADDKESLELLDKISTWHVYTITHNKFIEDNTPFTLHLGGMTFNFIASSAFSTIETYIEIFLKNNHFLCTDFIPQNNQFILDIGANQGYYSLKTKSRAPNCNIIAFEPNPLMYDALLKNINSNNVKMFESENVAIADKDGFIDLEIVPQIGAIGGKSVRIPERKWMKDEFIHNITAKALALDTVFTKYKINKVDILKLDVEGMEFEILSNCHNLDKVERLVIEYHSEKIKEQLIKLLESQKFSLSYVDYEQGDYYGDIYFTKSRP